MVVSEGRDGGNEETDGDRGVAGEMSDDASEMGTG